MAFKLKGPLKLQSSNDLGQLPAGAVLYPYTSGPSTNTYILFINTKNEDMLEPIKFDRVMTVVPIDAYSDN